MGKHTQNTLCPTFPSKKSIRSAQNYLIEQKAFGFCDGGCHIFAEAIKFIIPDCEIVTILRNKKPDHYGVYLPKSNLWADANGLFENQYIWAQKFAILENISGNLIIKKEFIPSNSIPKDTKIAEKIAEILIN